VALKRAVSVSRAMVSETVAARAQLDAEVAQQEARLKELQAAYERVRKLLPNAASELEVDQAKFRVEAQQSLLESTRRQRPVLDATIARYRAEAEAAERDLELRVDHRRALDEARASVKDAETAVAEAKLRLKRTEVTSPVSGIVMRRLAAPGAKMMLGMDSPHSAHVVHLYDPEKLQVRVDVPLADAAKVGVGQSAEVVVDVLPDETFRGEVTRFVHEADISKNTVEVKVAIEEPSALLKPDMLARVKFFGASDGAASPPGESSTTGATRVYVPEEVIRDDAGERVVWAVRPDQTVERRVIATGATRGDGWIEVTSGLRPGDTVVADATVKLSDGQRVRTIED